MCYSCDFKVIGVCDIVRSEHRQAPKQEKMKNVGLTVHQVGGYATQKEFMSL